MAVATVSFLVRVSSIYFVDLLWSSFGQTMMLTHNCFIDTSFHFSNHDDGHIHVQMFLSLEKTLLRVSYCAVVLGLKHIKANYTNPTIMSSNQANFSTVMKKYRSFRFRRRTHSQHPSTLAKSTMISKATTAKRACPKAATVASWISRS